VNTVVQYGIFQFFAGKKSVIDKKFGSLVVEFVGEKPDDVFF
jgi:hypothetical protein